MDLFIGIGNFTNAYQFSALLEFWLTKEELFKNNSRFKVRNRRFDEVNPWDISDDKHAQGSKKSGEKEFQ